MDQVRKTKLLRELIGCGLQEANEAIAKAQKEPEVYEDAVHALCTRYAHGLSVFVKGDRHAWDLETGRRKAADLRERYPELDEAFPKAVELPTP